MADERERKESEQKGRRFRLTRRVKTSEPPRAKEPAIESREERELRELAAMEDDADRGTPEEDASLRRGCMSMVRVVMLFFVVMFGSIIATWCLKR